jgi:hypothetical protein
MQVADYFASRGERPEEFAIGLDDSLIRVEGHDIGQFPGLDSQKPQVAEPQLTLSIWTLPWWSCADHCCSIVNDEQIILLQRVHML